ncbi:MAG: ribosomal RNA small subunit methyltransferase A [Candidatus Heimdallarchaeota archaeon]|nr:ribosomal RNA small subunit methyltransferase A [Candidatus Heimdallarchaeota archaeon]
MTDDLRLKVKQALIRAGKNPRKGLSQHFLINEEILEKQVNFAQLSQQDIVLEIGGGTGLLTEKLVEFAGLVHCIEYDTQLANYLKWRFKETNQVNIIEGDALEVVFPQTNKVVANLPYHISSPITFKLLDVGFELAILMYQYEFALRMIAKPGTDDYSRLSVNIQYLAEVEILEEVSRHDFYPMPRVDSAIVKLVPKKQELPVPKEHFRIVTRLLFNTKNKLVGSTIYESFKRNIPRKQRANFREELDQRLASYEKRIRELTIKELVEITKELILLLKEKNNLDWLFDPER